MHIFITFAAIIILFTGILYDEQTTISPMIQNGNDEVLSVTGVLGLNPTELVKPTFTPIPTAPLTSAPKSALVEEITILTYQYPNSEISLSSSDELALKSHDSVDSITDWYKSKIKNEGMNVKTFVTTKTNDKVENVLVGSNSKTQIRVEIKKEPSDNNVYIFVTKTSL